MSGTVEQWTWLFVGLGIALRLCRFALPFPLWCDEFQLADNFLDRDYRGLTEPLNNNQVAPVGFLWAELAATGFLGFHEWSLRLFPCLCGLASMLLMRQVARRLLSGVSQVLAVATLAVAYYPIRLGAEVKPYAGDLMCALVILACVVEWQRDRGRTLWLWVLAAVVAPILMISFPSVFVGGAASLTVTAIFAADWRLGKLPARRVVIPFVVYNVLLVGVFGAIVWMNAAHQYRATANDMVRCWALPVSAGTAMAVDRGGICFRTDAAGRRSAPLSLRRSRPVGTAPGPIHHPGLRGGGRGAD
ncbi:MAG: glycosyltransferase family 39 protein [Planctomycetota bacterium]|nr:glycosyltransferase family 39 protein [Planctomycetota bacterium]